MEQFLREYKQAIIGTSITALIVIIALVVFFSIYDPVKISFSGDDTKVIATQQTELHFKASATDKKKEKFDITWKVNGGSLSDEKGNEINWLLPNNEGTYTITAYAGNKQLTKKITVLPNYLISSSIVGDKVITYIDTDKDGLTDDYEINITKTDPKNPDTDGDGIKDGSEVGTGLDPLNKITKSDNVADAKRDLKYTAENTKIGVKVDLDGKGNIGNTTIDEYKINTVNEIPGVVSNVYNVYTEGTLNSATLSIKYAKEKITNGLKEENLAIYSFDPKNITYKKLDTIVDKTNAVLTAKTTSLGKFIVADSSLMKTNMETDLMFVIDNSGSMYSKEEISESAGNDTQFKRVELTNNIIDKLKGNYKFGAGKFTFEYTDLISMTSNREQAKEKINSIKTINEKFTGTYIGNALSGGLGQFVQVNNDGTRRYMILLTDGKDTTDVEGYDKDKLAAAIEDAKSKKVKVITIGLGSDIDNNILKQIASSTGGKYYYAASVDLLDNIFDLILSDLSYSFTNIDNGSNKEDIILNNTDFLVKRDSIAFENFPTKESNIGASYGMALLSKLYYEGKLPAEMSDISVKDENNDTIKAAGYKLSITNETATATATDTDTDNIPLFNYKFEDIDVLANKTNGFMDTSVSQSILKMKSEYRKKLLADGFSAYYIPYTKDKAAFKYYESYILDKNSQGYLNTMPGNDREFIDAIYRLDVIKYRDERYNFSKAPSKTYNILIDELSNKRPVILILNDSYAVSGIELISDMDNPNKMKIGIYDSNFKGEERYIDIERTKITKVVDGNKEMNDYEYGFTYDGKNVDVSIALPNISTNL